MHTHVILVNNTQLQSNAIFTLKFLEIPLLSSVKFTWKSLKITIREYINKKTIISCRLLHICDSSRVQLTQAGNNKDYETKTLKRGFTALLTRGIYLFSQLMGDAYLNGVKRSENGSTIAAGGFSLTGRRDILRNREVVARLYPTSSIATRIVNVCPRMWEPRLVPRKPFALIQSVRAVLHGTVQIGYSCWCTHSTTPQHFTQWFLTFLP